MTNRFWIALLLCATLCIISTSARAQTTFPDLGHIGPSTGEVVGILVGAGVAIGVVLYLVVPKHKTIEGCIMPGDGGLRLVSERSKQTYALGTDNITLQPGHRFTLKGKQGKKHSGSRDFRVTKLVKDAGSCHEHGSLPTPGS